MKDLFICCPFHSDGQERTPSLSILLQDKGSLRAGFAHCFACGWTGNYRQVEKALGYPLDLSPSVRATLDKRAYNSSVTRTALRTPVDPSNAPRLIYKDDLPFKYSPYLKQRGIGEVVQRYNKVYQNGVLNMPFFDKDGVFMGSVERGVTDQKFYKVNGSIRFPIGIEGIQSKDFVYIVEGQIDKMSLEEAGFKAVALGTVSNYKLIRYIKNFNLCLAFDNDEAGQKAIELAFQYIKTTRNPNLYMLSLPSGVKDINELLVRSGREETSDWVKYNTRRL
jgi:hypothetical protein